MEVTFPIGQAGFYDEEIVVFWYTKRAEAVRPERAYRLCLFLVSEEMLSFHDEDVALISALWLWSAIHHCRVRDSLNGTSSRVST